MENSDEMVNIATHTYAHKEDTFEMDFRTHPRKESRPFDIRASILSLVVVVAAIMVPAWFSTPDKKVEV